VGISWVVGFRVLDYTYAVTGAFGYHHNNRQKIVHLQESIGKRRETRLSKNSIDWRRDGGTISEIRWAFLELWWVSFFWSIIPLLLGDFGHHHNNRQKIVHARESIGKRVWPSCSPKFCRNQLSRGVA